MAVDVTLTVEEVLSEVERIRSIARDDEVAHSFEDGLHQRVLLAISTGTCADPAGCARAALTTRDIDFDRWCT